MPNETIHRRLLGPLVPLQASGSSSFAVPFEGSAKASVRVLFWLPSQLRTDLGDVNRVAPVVPGPIIDERDEFSVRPAPRADLIHQRAEPNSLFVFTADHSALSNTPEYKTRLGRFAIPFFIYDPSGSLKGTNNEPFQHIDISPTIINLVSNNNKVITFGNSAFNTTSRLSQVLA